MNLQGSTIDFPFRSDSRGTFVTTDDRATVIGQAIEDILETVRGERVLCPDYGIPDFLFSVLNSSFIHRFAYVLEQQIRAYVPLVLDVKIKEVTNDAGRVFVEIRYTEVGSINAPGNLVFPVWRYREQSGS